MTDSPDPTVITLSPSLDHTAIEDLLQALRKARNSAVVIAAGKVTRASTIGLQALLSAQTTWKSDGHDFHVAATPPSLAEAARLLGLPADFLSAEGSGA